MKNGRQDATAPVVRWAMRALPPLALLAASLAAPPSARADSTIPDVPAGDVVRPWSDYCRDRLARAREELARLEPRFRAATVRRLETPGGGLVLAGPEGQSATVTAMGAGATEEGWRTVALRGSERRAGGLLGALGRGDRAHPDRRFESIARRAVDDCLAAGRLSPGAARSLAGSWSFTGDYAFDGCNRSIVLHTGEFIVAKDQRSVYAVPLERTYAAHLENGMLIASAELPDNTCPGKTFTERWVLTPSASGRELHGQLDTTWLRDPLCGATCDVDFRIDAKRK